MGTSIGWPTEDVAVKRLLWYLNAGGRRRYKTTALPDVEEHQRGSVTRKTPDCLCIDEVTGARIAVEVKSIHSKGISPEALNYADRLGDRLRRELALRSPASRVQVFFYMPIARQRKPVEDTASELARAVLEALDASHADMLDITRPLPVRILRNSFTGDVECSPFINLGFEGTDIATRMATKLLDAQRKFERYSGFRRIILFVANRLFLVDEAQRFLQAYQLIPSEVRGCADRAYLLTSVGRVRRLE
jgi:hypothetical protein